MKETITSKHITHQERTGLWPTTNSRIWPLKNIAVCLDTFLGNMPTSWFQRKTKSQNFLKIYLQRVLRLTQCNFRALARTDRTSTGKIKELLIQYTTRVSSVPQATPLRRQMQLLQPTSLQKTNCLSFHSNRLFRASILFITLPTPA